MTFRTRVEHTRLLAGCSRRVAGPTAIVDLGIEGDVPITAPQDALRAIARGLLPSQPMYGVTDRDWPDAFLVPGGSAAPDDTAPGWMGRWVVALTVAIQRWGFDPCTPARSSQPDPASCSWRSGGAGTSSSPSLWNWHCG